jgi:hypothetical protein
MLKRTITTISLLLVACGGSAVTASDIIGSPSDPVTQADAGVDADKPTAKTPVLDAGMASDATVIDAGNDASLSPDATSEDAGLDAGQPQDAGQNADSDAGQSVDAGPPQTYYGVSFQRGTTQYILSDEFPAGVVGLNQLTLEGWFLLRQPTDQGYLFSTFMTGISCSYAGAPAYGIMQGHLNCLAAANAPLPANQVFSQQAVTLGTWFHVALVLKAGTFTLYVDGKSQGTMKGDFGNTTNVISHFTVGGTGRATNETIDGIVDEFRFSATADYTADFLPPTHLAPSGAISMLLDQGAGTAVPGGKLLNGCSWLSVDR